MKCTNSNMMTTALIYINKKSTITNNDENIKRKFEEKSKKILTPKKAKATNNNPFAYLFKNDKKQEINNVTSIDMMVGIIFGKLNNVMKIGLTCYVHWSMDTCDYHS